MDAIRRMVLAAAFEDPRFPPLQSKEVPELKIDISILGPLTKISRWEDVELGRHGIFVKYKSRSGTFLPEVAADQGWDRDEFIRQCALSKAGISEEEIPLMELSRYEVIKISEA